MLIGMQTGSFKEKAHNGADGGGARGIVRALVEDLRTLNGGTESDFLSIGTSLSTISARAKKISGTASSVASLVVSDGVAGNTERLRATLDTVDGHFRTFHDRLQRNSHILNRVLGMIAAAHGPLSVFKKIVKHLHMLGISTKIESERFNGTDRSFGVLAEDVEKLSVVIAARSDAIFKGLIFLDGAIKKTLTTVFNSGNSKGQRIWTMPDSLFADLATLAEKRTSASEAAGRLSVQSEGVSRSISDVVSLLQVHDITRQQIEHVMETLDEILNKTSKDGPDDANLLQVIGDIGGIQVSQLEHAGNELASSMRKVIDDLGRIAHHVSTVTGDTMKLVNAAGESGSSFLSELNRSISSVMTSFRVNREMDGQLSTAMESVSRTIGDLSHFVNDIEEIGSEIELIALNARVKAAHAAEDGAALGVLAEAIRNLSDSARGQTLTLTGSLKGISDAALELNEEAGDEKKPEETRGNMERLRDSLSSSHASLLELLIVLRSETGELTHSIDSIVAGITAHTRTDEVINSVVSRLKELITSGKSVASTGAANEISEYLKDMASRYTMRQERHIHQSGIRPGVHLNTDTDESLGDNVELF
jgi:methyl-accepting chemotaxis protein